MNITLFHVTHWKAGSVWIDRILRTCVFDRLVPVPKNPYNAQFTDAPIQQGMVYPRLYVTRDEFESASLPERWRRFVVIRDLRDALVSAYFSVRYSHSVAEFPVLARERAALERLNRQDGLRFMLDTLMVAGSAKIQASWAEAGEPVLRYEDLLARDGEILEETLIERCELGIPREKLRDAVQAARFDQVTKGRARGNEDISQHLRKGVAGDWRNYFDDRLREEFKTRYGRLLIATGYEDDFQW